MKAQNGAESVKFCPTPHKIIIHRPRVSFIVPVKKEGGHGITRGAAYYNKGGKCGE